MNNRLIQQYAIIASEEAIELAEEINKAHHAFLFNLNATHSLQLALIEYNELAAVFELLVAEIYGSEDQNLDLLVSHVVVTEQEKKSLWDAVQGIRLAGANSDICKSLMTELFQMSKAFCKIARFGVSTFDPYSHKLAFHRIVTHFLLVTEAIKALLPSIENLQCADAKAEKKGKVRYHMAITQQAGLL